jgi:catechol 2,3-dioxygenase-like lactoylglutathione lyase family enzyme
MKSDYTITFFYYQNLPPIAEFYENIMKFETVLVQEYARLYRVGKHSYFGIVDGNKGHLRHQKKSAALLTIVAEDVKGWHAWLASRGVQGLTDVRDGTFCEHFFFRDPAGYALEVQRFHDPEVAALFT